MQCTCLGCACCACLCFGCAWFCLHVSCMLGLGCVVLDQQSRDAPNNVSVSPRLTLTHSCSPTLQAHLPSHSHAHSQPPPSYPYPPSALLPSPTDARIDVLSLSPLSLPLPPPSLSLSLVCVCGCTRANAHKNPRKFTLRTYGRRAEGEGRGRADHDTHRSCLPHHHWRVDRDRAGCPVRILPPRLPRRLWCIPSLGKS
jgi:hypothetical protein